MGDEVLVALSQNDTADAFILGGLWSTADQPPVVDSAEATAKRVIKTGLKGGVGHEIEMDDALQSISIVSTTKQKITIDPDEDRAQQHRRHADDHARQQDPDDHDQGRAASKLERRGDASSIDRPEHRYHVRAGPITIAAGATCSIGGTCAVEHQLGGLRCRLRHGSAT